MLIPPMPVPPTALYPTYHPINTMPVGSYVSSQPIPAIPTYSVMNQTGYAPMNFPPPNSSKGMAVPPSYKKAKMLAFKHK